MRNFVIRRPKGSILRSTTSRLLALLFAFAMVAAACGGSGSDEATGTTSAETEEVVEDIEENDATGDDTRDDAGEAVRGGRLVYGIEADSANPWTHYATSCAISCRMILRSIADPLFATADDGTIQPYLVDTMEPNADATEWTMTIKEGITFHDGTPLDAAAVKYNLDTCRMSPLTGPAFLGLDDVQADGQVVTLTYAAPEAAPQAGMREEVCGLMLSPEWMATLPNNPLLSEEEKAAAKGNPAAPVGSGPFQFVSYTPGNGNSFIAERFEDYWRGDGANSVTGEGLPYLDEIEFVVAVDIQSRANGLKSGQFDIIHTANADEINKFLTDEDFVTLAANDFGETSHVLINTGAGENPVLASVRGLDSLPMDPGGLNAANPLLNLSCRKALAHAIDLEEFAEVRQGGLAAPANGPFPPGSMGYLADSGYPKFDLEAAKAEWETCKTDVGSTPVTFTYNTTNDPKNVEDNEFIAQMWREAFGDEISVSITPIEQGQYIGLALAGVFQAQGWRNHGGVDPTEQWYWWHPATSSPIDPEVPELALNFGRFQDMEMMAAITEIRQNTDPAARQAAAEEVNRQFGKNVWNFWLYWTVWGVIFDNRVQDTVDAVFPGTTDPIKPIISGKHHIAQIWCLEGDCQG